MTDFFDSDIVRGEAREMEELQTKAMQLTMEKPLYGTKEQALDYIGTIRSLIEKQQSFSTKRTSNKGVINVLDRKSVV